MPGTRSQQAVLFILLTLAAVLRFAPFSDPAYAHDELSALVRLHPTLSATLTEGVVGVDTHPPGVQVFLWAWTKLVGLDERWVKLPFMLASLGALVLLYRVAARLTDVPVALVTTALLSTVQYTVLYGQLARPYAFGLFTTAWMADRSLVYLDEGRRRTLIPIALAAALSAYTHHLAALQALLIGATVLVLLPATKRTAYLTACMVALLAYLPNLALLRAQLAWKGLDEWLTRPTPGWFIDHARFVTHWSVVLGGALAALVLFALARGLKRRSISRRLVLISLAWGLAPYLITYVYSVWRAPVLQHSVVLFAFPYVLLLLLSGWKGASFRTTTVLAGSTALIATVTLITTRQHFALNSGAHNRYEAIARGIVAAHAAGIPALTDAPEHMLRFHLDRWNVPAAQRTHIDLSGMDVHRVNAVLDSLNADRLFLGITLQAPPERHAQVRRWLPFLVERHDMVEGQTFILSARPRPCGPNDVRYSTMAAPPAIRGEGWALRTEVRTVRASDSRAVSWSLEGEEFGVSCGNSLAGLHAMPFDELEAALDVAPPAPAGSAVVLDMHTADGHRSYSASPDEQGGSRLAVLPLNEGWSALQRTMVEAYVWNPGRARLLVNAVTLRVREGDPVRFAWLGPIRGEWTYR